MAKKIKHNIFCECNKCEPSISSYMRKLKKDLVWKDGHLV